MFCGCLVQCVQMAWRASPDVERGRHCAAEGRRPGRVVVMGFEQDHPPESAVMGLGGCACLVYLHDRPRPAGINGEIPTTSQSRPRNPLPPSRTRPCCPRRRSGAAGGGGDGVGVGLGRGGGDGCGGTGAAPAVPRAGDREHLVLGPRRGTPRVRARRQAAALHLFRRDSQPKTSPTNRFARPSRESCCFVSPCFDLALAARLGLRLAVAPEKAGRWLVLVRKKRGVPRRGPRTSSQPRRVEAWCEGASWGLCVRGVWMDFERKSQPHLAS